MPVIQNRRSLLSHGNSRLRRAALNIIEAALADELPMVRGGRSPS